MSSNDRAIPTLPSRSLANTLEFYARLGFTGRILGAGDSYAIVERGAVELHFFLHAELQPAQSHAGCYIRVTDVASLHQSFAAAQLPRHGIPRMDPLSLKPWGMNEFAIVDPDGNLLRIGQVVSAQPR